MQAVLALLNQSLQQDCRQWSTALLRSVAVLILLGVMFIFSATPAGATGLGFASWLMWLDYAGITLAAFSWFATAIAEEREQGTLGLLRMTGVPGASVLLGKWLPRVVVVQVLLVVQIPMAVLAITMGGVTAYQLLAAYVALMAYTIMMSAIGLLWSTVCTSARRASSMAMVCWALHVCGPPLWKTFLPRGVFNEVLPAGISTWFARTGPFIESVHNMSLFRRLSSIFAIQFDESIMHAQITSNVLIGLGAFGIAWFVFGHITLYNLETPVKAPRRLFKRTARKRAGKRPTQVGRVWSWPFAWKQFYFSTGGWTRLFTKLVFYPGIGLIIISLASAGSMTFRDAWDVMAATTFMFSGGTGVLIEVAGAASRLFGSEVHEGTVGGLMTLPVSVAEIGYGKLAGTAITLVPALATFVFGCGVGPELATEFFRNWFTLAGLWVTVGYFVFVHFSAYLSLHFRVGGSLIAFFLCWLLGVVVQLIGMFLGSWVRTQGDAVLVLLSCLGIALCVFLQLRIGKVVRYKGTT